MDFRTVHQAHFVVGWIWRPKELQNPKDVFFAKPLREITPRQKVGTGRRKTVCFMAIYRDAPHRIKPLKRKQTSPDEHHRRLVADVHDARFVSIRDRCLE